MQLYRYFASQSSEFCRHNTLYCFSSSVCCCCLFRYRLSPETFGYTIVFLVKCRIVKLAISLSRFLSLVQDSLVSIATRLRAGRSGFDPREGQGRVCFFFSFAPTSRPALRPTQPPIRWVTSTLSPWVKRPGHEADHSPPSNAKSKNAWSYTSTPQYVFTAWCLVKKIQLHEAILS
jgi:hypothetical protein